MWSPVRVPHPHHRSQASPLGGLLPENPVPDPRGEPHQEAQPVIVLPLSLGAIAVIDDRDGHLAKFKWSACRRGSLLYAFRNKGRVPVYLHKEIMGDPPFPRAKVDHCNGRGTDCRRANLRWTTHQENLRNRKHPTNNTSGFKGVSRKRGKWRAYITVDDKQINLGVFKSKGAANKARLKAEAELFGIQPRRAGLYGKA